MVAGAYQCLKASELPRRYRAALNFRFVLVFESKELAVQLNLTINVGGDDVAREGSPKVREDLRELPGQEPGWIADAHGIAVFQKPGDV